MLVRQRQLLDSLDDNTFDSDVYMDKYGIREKTVLRDFKALAERGELFDHRVSILRKKCLGKLTQKASDGTLADNLMVNIVLSGVTSKTEVKQELTKKTEHVETTRVLHEYVVALRQGETTPIQQDNIT